MPAPTISSKVLQSDGRYLVTLSDGATLYSSLGELLVIDYLAQILAAGGGGGSGGTVNQGTAGTDPWPVLASIDTTGLATDTGQTAQTADLDSIVASLADVGAAGTLADLDDAVTVALATHAGAGFAAIDAGGFDGELTAELSFDGGTSWSATYSSNPVRDGRWLQAVPSSDSEFTSADFFTIALFGGPTQVRVRCSAYTAGGVTVTLTATAVASQYTPTDAKTNQVAPPYGTMAMGSDGGTARPLALDSVGRLQAIIVAIGTVIGTEANLWNGDVLNAGDASNAIALGLDRAIAIFGHVSAATRILVQASLDGSAFYGVAVSNPIAADSDFGFTGADFSLPAANLSVRLVTESAATITASLAASG